MFLLTREGNWYLCLLNISWMHFAIERSYGMLLASARSSPFSSKIKSYWQVGRKQWNEFSPVFFFFFWFNKHKWIISQALGIEDYRAHLQFWVIFNSAAVIKEIYCSLTLSQLGIIKFQILFFFSQVKIRQFSNSISWLIPHSVVCIVCLLSLPSNLGSFLEDSCETDNLIFSFLTSYPLDLMQWN